MRCLGVDDLGYFSFRRGKFRSCFEELNVRNKGNPNWGKPWDYTGSTPSSFEEEVRRLGLEEKDYKNSAALKEWVKRNKDAKFVPCDLLRASGLSAS